MAVTKYIIGYNKKFFSFGKSLFREQSWSISFINNEYLLINEYGALIGRNEKYTAFDKDLKRKGRHKSIWPTFTSNNTILASTR